MTTKELDNLRKRAEAKPGFKSVDLSEMSEKDILKAFQELHTHQIELEMQNEELKLAHIELEESQKNFIEYYDYTPKGYFTVSDKGLIISANLSACLLLGEERKYLLSQPFTEFISSEDQDILYLCRKTLFDTKKKQVCYLHMQKKDGNQFDAQLDCFVIPNRDEADHYRIIIDDITERKQEEEALKEAKAFNESALNAINEIFYAFDLKGKFLVWNKTFSKISGYSDQELSSMKPMDFFLDEDIRRVAESIERIYKEGTSRVEANFVLKDGRQIPCEFSGSVLKGGKDNVIGFSGTGRDITERKQAELERIKFQAQINQDQKMKATGVMAGGIAHDYNNLLGVILGSIDMAEEDAAIGSRQAKALNAAIRATQKAASLTKKFITFSSGGSPVKNALNTQEFIKDTVSIALSGSNIQCDFSIDHDLRMVEIDQDQMSQAIGNIITNAKEAMPQGGTIHLTAHNMSDEQITHETGLNLQGDFFVKITVEDQGKGITKTIMANIFDPYFSSKERGEQKGMGLGLTIANSIIKKHTGHIQVESEEGKGTTVSIYLPAVQKNEAVVCQSTDKVVDHPPTAPEKKTTRILVMDDEEMLRDMTKDLLGRLGYEQVDVAPHGKDVLKMYTQARDHGEPLDLLLLDLTIKGGLGGEETIKRLYEINPEVRAIVCSGYSKNPVLANYAAFGFIGVLAKPFSREELNAAITQALNKK